MLMQMAMSSMFKVVFLWNQVEQLEQEVAELRRALAEKQEQENAMLQVSFLLSSREIFIFVGSFIRKCFSVN